MTITDLIPGRRHAKHRGKTGLELKREIAAAERKLAAAERKIASLIAGMDQLSAERNDIAAQLDETRIDLAGAHKESAEWRVEASVLSGRLAPFLAAEANAHRVDVPPMERPIDGPEDQATAPIDVRPLWQALGLGAVTVVDNPNAADPARITT